MAGAVTFDQWLHALPPAMVRALGAFRDAAVRTYVDAENPVSAALSGPVNAMMDALPPMIGEMTKGQLLTAIAAMPPDFVARIYKRKD